MQGPAPGVQGPGRVAAADPSASQVNFSSVLEPRTCPAQGTHTCPAPAPRRGPGPQGHCGLATFQPRTSKVPLALGWSEHACLPARTCWPQTLLSADGVLLPAVNSRWGCRTLKWHIHPARQASSYPFHRWQVRPTEVSTHGHRASQESGWPPESPQAHMSTHLRSTFQAVGLGGCSFRASLPGMDGLYPPFLPCSQASSTAPLPSAGAPSPCACSPAQPGCLCPAGRPDLL